MIRRLFWVTLGAVLGVAGYRRLTALARAVSPAARAQGLARFAGDVREGMQLYMERQPVTGALPSKVRSGPAGRADRPARRTAGHDGH